MWSCEMNFCSMNILRDGMQCNLIDIGSSGEATKLVSLSFCGPPAPYTFLDMCTENPPKSL